MSTSHYERVQCGLKDFQRRTVEHVFRRLYTDAQPTHRFLIADEVGLGKTLVARGLIARAIDHLQAAHLRREREHEQVNVVYICSNAGVARQNIRRLNVTGVGETALASRLTLLPYRLHGLRNNPINFISFTPGTSFDLRSNLGVASERAILYELLRRAGWFRDSDSALAVLTGHAALERFRWEVRCVRDEGEPDDALEASFRAALNRPSDLNARFDSLRDRIARAGGADGELGRERNRWVGELRELLAGACLGALHPDVIVLDEFQRFKHLLATDEEETDLSRLARDFFASPDARVLLLSATPYKMYTLAHEREADDHYRDFMQTLRFLLPGGAGALEAVLRDYRRELLRLAGGDRAALCALSRQLAERLRRVMSRTERTAAGRAGGVREVIECGALAAADLRGYLTLQRVARALERDDTLEFWKSAPYLLNFMDGYELDRGFRAALAHPRTHDELAAALDTSPDVLLPWRAATRYEAIDPRNPRLRGLAADTVGAGWWKLLWVPPTLPYHAPAEPFASVAPFTKRLLFSAWRVAPKAVAGLLSYEAERQMIRSHERAPRNNPKARKERRALLRFTRATDKRTRAKRLTGMPVLGLLYPSAALARLADPRARSPDGPLPTLDEMLKKIQDKLAPRLAELTAGQSGSDTIDENWYWAAPILLDRSADPAGARAWFARPDLADRWSGADDDATGRAWADHVEEARRLVRGELPLGAPPKKLAAVLARVALAGPGVVAFRALGRVCAADDAALRDAAGVAAWGFRTLFNLPEVTALVRGLFPQGPYWRKALRYAAAGGLQAALDEYAHLLTESLGLSDAPPAERAAEIGAAIRRALSLRTAQIGVQQVRVSRGRVTHTDRHLRARFAMRLTDDPSDGGGATTPADHVRDAFNSPFWPFVLATTSVGQEGLDFHHYCHAVVHWNLPANPVDMEQREGRVDRYKNHAVRKNLARRHGAAALGAGTPDPWAALFAAAHAARPPGSTDLTPYWVFADDGGAAVERHVPALPLSRDREKLDDLRESLAAYRLVFGQARQDDLVAFLRRHAGAGDLDALATELAIDLSPPG